jgi:hypothetical protein
MPVVQGNPDVTEFGCVEVFNVAMTMGAWTSGTKFARINETAFSQM